MSPQPTVEPAVMVAQETSKTQPSAVNGGWYLYLIECQNGRLYTGITTDLGARFDKHCAGKGAMFTRLNKPLKMLAAKPYPNRSDASKAEYHMKRLTPARKREQAADWPLTHNLPRNIATERVP